MITFEGPSDVYVVSQVEVGYLPGVILTSNHDEPVKSMMVNDEVCMSWKV